MFFVILLSWVVTGLVVGFIASKVVNLRGDDPKIGIGAAAGGAVLVGILYAVIGDAGVSTWTWWGILFAALGATLATVAWHVVRSRTISHAKYVPRSSY
jgi:uncharacterized membrane protein YeaQ/YmgE (transglycosylase-associated protein family)